MTNFAAKAIINLMSSIDFVGVIFAVLVLVLLMLVLVILPKANTER